MRRLRSHLLLALVAAAPACTCQSVPAPVLTSVDPGSTPTDQGTRLTVRGDHFQPQVIADLDDPASSVVNVTFSLTLLSGGTRVPLRILKVVSSQQIDAWLDPLAAAPGTYDLELVDPAGARATLSAAVSVLASGCKGLPDGTACDDNNPCTQTDSCQGGLCLGANPVVCTALDQCHDAGACDPPSGSSACSNPVKANGTVCDDADKCTQTDTCQGGACVGANPVVCTALDQCHDVGACDPGTGACSNPAKANGTACNADNDACTPDSCQAGSCLAGTRKTCSALDACHVAGICDPGTGACSDPAKPDGSPCGSGGACDTSQSCQAGACTATPAPGILPPLACLVATPVAATAGSTTVAFDATCSTDLQDPAAALEGRFVFDYGSFTGTWDTTFSNGKTASHLYPAAAVYTAAVEIRNTCSVSAYAYADVVVSDPASIVRVTTAADENDASATPAAPGGTGLSLREAINYVNTLAAPATIQFDEAVFAAPTQVKVLSGLPALSRAGALIVGKPEVTLDFAGAALAGVDRPCLWLHGANQGAYQMRITGCAGTSVLTDQAGARVAEATVVGVAGSTGILARGPATIGPRNDVSGCATGIVLRSAGANCAVDGNRAHGNGIGIQVDSTDNASVGRNLVYGNASHGIQLTDTKSSSVQFNTVDGNAGSGLDVDNQTRTVVLQDNLLTWNGAYGVAAWPQTTFTSFDHNGYYLNTAGDTFRTPPVSADSVVGQDPLFVSRATADFRLRPGSPVIDKGVDVGVDVNGPSAGNFNGTAPDLGASETP